jgi:Zn-dependent protease with chaperone function
MVPGRYFDGISSRGQDVSVSAGDGTLTIDGPDLHREIFAAQLRLTMARAPAPICITIGDGSVCELADSPQSRALLEQIGVATSIESWLHAHRAMLLCLAALLLAVMAGVWRWGIPLAADLIVDHVPPAWDREVGDSVLQQLESGKVFEPSSLPAARQEQLQRRFEALVKPAGVPEYRIAFRRLGAPNAFALPGGSIVVGDELVALAPDDDAALMTVLGHEMGHLHYRHGMRALVRATLFSAVAAWYLGDISGVAAGAAAGFTSLSYSRDAERAADLYALQLMQANGLSTRPAVVLFQRLVDWQPGPRGDAGGAAAGHIQVPEYLSTHPDMRDRIHLFEQGGEARPVAHGSAPSP